MTSGNRSGDDDGENDTEGVAKSNVEQTAESSLLHGGCDEESGRCSKSRVCNRSGASVPFRLLRAELVAAKRTDIEEHAHGLGDALDEKSRASALPVDEPARRFRQMRSAFPFCTAVLQQVGNLQRRKGVAVSDGHLCKRRGFTAQEAWGEKAWGGKSLRLLLTYTDFDVSVFAVQVVTLTLHFVRRSGRALLSGGCSVRRVIAPVLAGEKLGLRGKSVVCSRRPTPRDACDRIPSRAYTNCSQSHRSPAMRPSEQASTIRRKRAMQREVKLKVAAEEVFPASEIGDRPRGLG